MINQNDFLKKLRKMTTENVQVIHRFIEKETPVTYSDISNILKIQEDAKDSGRSIGGILSTLSRTKFNDKPLIISVGPSKEEKRRLLWKLNPRLFNEENKNEVLNIVNEVLSERE